MTPPKSLHRASDAAWRRVEDQVAVISMEVNRVRLLNEVGSFIWERCEGATADELVAAVCARFAVDDDQARRDVTQFLGDLAARGMIVADTGTAP